MKISDIKDLEKIIKLCRRTGVEHIIIDGVELNLGPEPRVYREPKRQVIPTKEQAMEAVLNPGINYTPGEDTQITVGDTLTPEQLLMWSSQSAEEQ